MKRAFTLIEVNLAILVMAGGILSVVVLYTLGFRETRQSREDVISAAYADEALGPLVAAMSDMDLDWDKFNGVTTKPSNGWGGFLSGNRVQENTEARKIFQDFGVKEPSLPDGCKWGIVVSHEKNSGLIKIGFRAAKKLDALLAAPLYYTEVRFQGKQKVFP